MNRARLAIVVAVMAACSSVMAQGKGSIRLNVVPLEGREVILDGKERSKSSALDLPAGMHRFVFYAPYRSLVDTTVMVLPDTTVMLRLVMPISAEYRAYRSAKQAVAWKKLLWRGVPLICTGVGVVLTNTALAKNNEAYDALVEAEATYPHLRSAADIEYLKDHHLPELQQDLDDSQRDVVIGAAVTGLGLAATVYGFIRAARMELPTYEDTEKVRFDGMAYIPGPAGGVYASFTLPIR